MRKKFLLFISGALMLWAVLALYPDETAAYPGSLEQGNPDGEANILQALLSFRSGFAHVADGVMETLNSIWLTGGEATRCFLGVFFMLTFVFALVGVGAVNSLIGAYRRYIG